MAEMFRTRGGRTLRVLGDPSLLTMDRLAEFTARADSDARIASLSLVAGDSEAWVRATAPAGALVALALDVDELVGALETEDAAAVTAWARRASDRGLWHDWRLTAGGDVGRTPVLFPTAEADLAEAHEPSGAQYAASRAGRRRRGRLSVTVDISWLGPYETGAQVLTTAALGALAHHDGVGRLRLVGGDELPAYAAHLADEPRIELVAEPHGSTDVVWYPNQIDGRGTIADARRLGSRVVTTYLDLIAYDIARYHASPQAWLAYRALQRRIALSVDGITTISADVASRLLTEVPRLEPERVRPIPLGLDHIRIGQSRQEPGDDLAALLRTMGDRRFVLVLGNDFQHKNREFAVRVWQRVLQAGQPCDLVLAGLHVKGSSSRDEEDDLLARHVDLRGRAHTVGHVSSESRAWLLAHATAVHYPSSAEGFGLVPYEAATLGTPATYTDFGPLHEIAGVPDLPRTWSVEDHAADLVELLSDDRARTARIAATNEAIARHTWSGFADDLVEFFGVTLERPESPVSAVESGSEAAALASVLSSRTYRAAMRLRRMARRG